MYKLIQSRTSCTPLYYVYRYILVLDIHDLTLCVKIQQSKVAMRVGAIEHRLNDHSLNLKRVLL